MTNRIDVSKNGQFVDNRPHAVLGAGNLAALLWKCGDPRNGEYFRFNIFRMTKGNGQVSQRFGPQHVVDLAKLAQVLAFAFSEEECLEPESRDDLSCLFSCLGEVLGPDARDRKPLVPPKSPIAGALRQVLDSLWDVEAASFSKEPSSQHVYRQLVLVDRWLAGAVPIHSVSLPELNPAAADCLGDCPICGKNDGYLNVHRHHWFICHAHRTRWMVGEDLFSSWRRESPAEWKANGDRIRHYRTVEPVRPPEELSSSSA